ncbi:uncharacterized protein yc1106_06967 [Curvularia clavata]|uniref:Zn(2)-C6 fungal-type domain-containing protein n=1 Tax=Curvularia clavata TaxID=95742 RepID=A0A9Q8ZFB7_CURCL|nr:uncharacterized protein yc1106_06967 [Curvularia clavata]
MSAPGAEWISDRSRENTPPRRDAPEGDDGPSQRTSKKRKVLSCYACRNRKMKCDRVFPVCGRCEKTGRRHECTYDPRLLEESHVNVGAPADGDAPYVLVARPADSSPSVDTSNTVRWKATSQEKRTLSLEQQWVQQRAKHTPQFNEPIPEEPVIAEEFMLRGKGFKTQFNGGTSVISIASTYPELQAFTREALNVDHSIMRVKNDFKAFRCRKKQSPKEYSTGSHNSDADMFALLPEKSIVDEQSALYFQMCETSYRILHGPSFWKDYKAFWANKGSDKERVVFTVMLLLIIAVTKCLSPKDDIFIGDTTADRQSAHDLIVVCENWINLQPPRRITLPFCQTQCLLLLAKRVNCIGLKQDWINSGHLLRLALASGMHRNPGLQGNDRISLFDQQMKKRLWATVAELELQSSVESGIQSGLTSLYFDMPPPAHIEDEALSPDMQKLPPEQPNEQFTSTSYLIASLKTLPFRVNLTYQLNTPSSNIQYADVLLLDAQIHAALSSLPEWDNEAAVVPSALLRLQLHQYLLILHKQFAKEAHSNSRWMYSLTACVDVCNSMIEIHDGLLSKGILVLSHLRNDILRVGLTLSQVVFQNCAKHRVKSTIPSNPQAHSTDPAVAQGRAPVDDILYLAIIPHQPFIAKTLCTSSIKMLERVKQIFEQKVFRLGTGYMEYCIILTAVSMLPTLPPSDLTISYIENPKDEVLSRCKRILDSFTTLAFRVIAMQQDPTNSFAASLRATMSNASPSGDGAHNASAIAHDTANRLSMTPTNSEHSNRAQTNGADAILGSGIFSGDLDSPFDMLQDMQIDGSSWTFPDFWAFDLGGDF